MRKTQTQISLGDIGNEEHAYRKIRLRAEDVQEKNVLTPSKGRIFWLTSGYGLMDGKCFVCFHKFSLCSWHASNFHHFFWIIWGMDFTTDKLRSLVGKWHTLIEAYVDVQTTDNFPLRLFCIGFTKRLPNQVRRAYHAQTARLDR